MLGWEVVMALPEERLRVGERRHALELTARDARVSWGGVWGGLLVGLGLLMLLSALGLAIGVSTAGFGAREAPAARGLGLGAGIWAGASLLIALFFGGMVSARMGMTYDRPTAMLQGGLVWVLAMLGILYLTVSGISLGAGTLFGVAGGVARGAGAAVLGGAGTLAELWSGDIDQILSRLSDPGTVAVVAGATGMSQDDARSALAGLRQRVEAARDNPAQAAAAAREGVQQLVSRAGARAQAAAQAAQPYVARTSWGAFFAMLLGLIAAVVGALWGAFQVEAMVSGRR